MAEASTRGLAKIGSLTIIRPVTTINEEFETLIHTSDLRPPTRAIQQTQRRQANGYTNSSATKEAGSRRATFPATQSTPNAQTGPRATRRPAEHRKSTSENISTAEVTHEFGVSAEGSVPPLEREATLPTRCSQRCSCPTELKPHTVLRERESKLDHTSRASTHCQKCAQVSHAQKPHRCSHKPKLNKKLPDIPILDTYGHSNFSEFEQVPKDVKDCCLAEQCLTQSETIADAATKSLPRGIGDPIKRRSAVGYKLNPRTCYQHDSTALCAGTYCDSTAANPITTTFSASDISDREVFSGLQVALAAVCDRDIDAWIKEYSGYSVRRFLADLRDFEDLGVSALAGIAMKTAQQRRREYEGAADMQEAGMGKGAKTEDGEYE
jgi:hypothetical protein